MRRLLCAAALLVVAVPVTVACGAEAAPPDLSSREAFAGSVMTAAISGSVERVESLVINDRLNVRPEAQQLVDSTRGWEPGSWQLRLSNDFPEVANVDASRDGQPSSVRFQISWSHERWGLVLGGPRNPPTGGAGLGAVRAPSTGQPPIDCSGAEGLACRQYTSTGGNAPGQNLSWLTSTPLHVSFDRMDGALTLVVRMPCGVLNVPVVADAFSLTPDPDGLVESADGCGGPEGEHRTWTRAYFKEPMIYRLDAEALVLTNRLGQIRFTLD